MNPNDELERAIMRAAVKARENTLLIDHLDELAKLWRDRKALRGMLPDPEPWIRPELSHARVWLN